MDEYINQLKACPRGTVIADLGCGDAALARALVPQGLNVLSYDLVPDGVYVIEADICAGIPLPGSEPDEGMGEGHIVDMAICALSLMGSNWPECIREAWRILKPTYVSSSPLSSDRSEPMGRYRGQLKIAEVSSRFENVDQFVSLISSIGFKFKSKVYIYKPIRRRSELTEVFLSRTRGTPILRLLNSRKWLGRARRNRAGKRSCRKETPSNLANTNVVDVCLFQPTAAVYFMYTSCMPARNLCVRSTPGHLRNHRDKRAGIYFSRLLDRVSIRPFRVSLVPSHPSLRLETPSACKRYI